MALLPTRRTYEPLVTPQNVMSLLPSGVQPLPETVTLPGTPGPMTPPAPAPAPAPAPYDPVADRIVMDANRFYIDDQGNVRQVRRDTDFIPDTPGGMVSLLDPTQRQMAESTGLSPQDIAALSGDMRVSSSYRPPTPMPLLSAYRTPTENPVLDLRSLDDQPGYFFSTNAGNAADVRGNRSAFVPLDDNASYRLFNASTGEYISEGQGAQGLQDVYSAAQNLSATQGSNADWRVEMLSPGSDDWSTMARDRPSSGVLGTIADIGLPIAASFIPGVGPVLGAALGSAASSVAQGRSLENTLLRSALSAGASAAGGALLGGAAPGASESVTGGLLPTGGILPTVGGGFSATLGPATGSLASSAVPIVVSGGRATAPSVAGALAGGLGGGAAGSVVGSGGSPPEEPIVVTGDLTGRAIEPIDPNVISRLGPGMGSLTPEGDFITVERRRPTSGPNISPEDVLPSLATIGSVPLATLRSIAGGNLPTGGILESGLQPTDGTATLEGGRGLLANIARYYGLGSLGVDALGGLLGALGVGGGGGGAVSPYSGTLGPVPTFTRGQFTPYTGDYETYGFGPEFDFFSGQPTVAPTAPEVGILGPGTPVEEPVV